MQLVVPFLTVAILSVAGAAAAQQSAGPASPIRFDNVRLLVTRFDESYAFYRDVLGLKPTWGKPGDNYAAFAFSGGGEIAIFRQSLMADALGTSARPVTRREQDTTALILSVDDVDAWYSTLQSAGVQFVDPPKNQDAWGIRAMHFRDPDGNLIELFSPLKK
jgi:catechol 2,3-dioxygenase-like lactoylglutathione lyase family enzyme